MRHGPCVERVGFSNCWRRHSFNFFYCALWRIKQQIRGHPEKMVDNGQGAAVAVQHKLCRSGGFPVVFFIVDGDRYLWQILRGKGGCDLLDRLISTLSYQYLSGWPMNVVGSPIFRASGRCTDEPLESFGSELCDGQLGPTILYK